MAMNSSSVMLGAVSARIFDDNVSEQPEYVMLNPVLNFAVDLSTPTVVRLQFWQKKYCHTKAQEECCYTT